MAVASVALLIFLWQHRQHEDWGETWAPLKVLEDPCTLCYMQLTSMVIFILALIVVFEYIHVYSLCVHMCGCIYVHRWVYMCACVFGGQAVMLFPKRSPPSLLRQGFSLEPRAHQSRQLASGIPCLCLLLAGITGRLPQQPSISGSTTGPWSSYLRVKLFLLAESCLTTCKAKI